MSLTEEQRGTVAFDLEKAREICEKIGSRKIFNAGCCTVAEMVTMPEHDEPVFCEVAHPEFCDWCEILPYAVNSLPSLMAEIERLRALPVADVAAYDHRIQEMAARIAELEKWLKKERSARLLEQSSSIRLAYLVENKIDFDDFFEGKALEQLQADGKISIGDHIVGPDQMVPSWQITEEREAAVDFAIEYISANDSNDPGICFCVASLRAMLTEAE
jgi:hypothetical protein